MKPLISVSNSFPGSLSPHPKSGRERPWERGCLSLWFHPWELFAATLLLSDKTSQYSECICSLWMAEESENFGNTKCSRFRRFLIFSTAWGVSAIASDTLSFLPYFSVQWGHELLVMLRARERYLAKRNALDFGVGCSLKITDWWNEWFELQYVQDSATRASNSNSNASLQWNELSVHHVLWQQFVVFLLAFQTVSSNQRANRRTCNVSTRDYCMARGYFDVRLTLVFDWARKGRSQQKYIIIHSELYRMTTVVDSTLV